MPKVDLDLDTFKVLASETRLDILKALDGKKMGLNEISENLKLHKVTLHEHLSKLSEAGLVKRKRRPGHKWVYYTLSWKGKCLLHPENSKIVVLITFTIITLTGGIISLLNLIYNFFKTPTSNSRLEHGVSTLDDTPLKINQITTESTTSQTFDPLSLILTIILLSACIVLVAIIYKKYIKNRKTWI
ncbi:MAG: winged helix-turn-helix domain-containing protein [Candidatus Thermoplasmatota archaeon]